MPLTRKRKAAEPEKVEELPKRARRSNGTASTGIKAIKEEPVKVEKAPTPRKGRSTPKKAKESVETREQEEETVDIIDSPVLAKTIDKGAKKQAKGRKGGNVKAEEEPEANGGDSAADEKTKKPKQKRKTKEEKEAKMQPLAARTLGSKILVGAHVSASGGVQNAVVNSVHIGGNAFALFLKSQRKWANPALQADHCSQFHDHCKKHKYDTPSGDKHLPIVPHGSYLVNMAHPDKDRIEQAYGSFIDDLDRCRQLGIQLYNFHPGNCAANSDRAAGLGQIAKSLNRAHKDPQSGTVITLLETMAAVESNTLGSTFEDLAQTIAMVDDKSRIGVCLDTCHIFAAGYDIRTPETYAETMAKFDEVVGLTYLKALHVNDSKAPLRSGRDLHANIGTGFIGLRGFHNLVNDERIWGLPLILETPTDKKDDKGKTVEDKSVWAKEIKLLESLVGMDVGSEEFKKLEKELASRGSGERDRIQAQVDKRKEKGTPKKGGKGGKGKKGKKDESSDGEEDEE